MRRNYRESPAAPWPILPACLRPPPPQPHIVVSWHTCGNGGRRKAVHVLSKHALAFLHLPRRCLQPKKIMFKTSNLKTPPAVCSVSHHMIQQTLPPPRALPQRRGLHTGTLMAVRAGEIKLHIACLSFGGARPVLAYPFCGDMLGCVVSIVPRRPSISNPTEYRVFLPTAITQLIALAPDSLPFRSYTHAHERADGVHS